MALTFAFTIALVGTLGAAVVFLIWHCINIARQPGRRSREQGALATLRSLRDGGASAAKAKGAPQSVVGGLPVRLYKVGWGGVASGG